MNARKYAEEFNQKMQRGQDSLSQVHEWLTMTFIRETQVLVGIQCPQTDKDYFEVFEEIDQKWYALCREAQGALPLNGYQQILKQWCPAIHALWMVDKQRQKTMNIYSFWHSQRRGRNENQATSASQ